MCMKTGQFPCIFTGTKISDNTYVAITASGNQCRPFSSDPLEVSFSSDRCSGSWMVTNGIAKRPGCVFCNGAIDDVIEPEPSIGLGAPEYLSVSGFENCLGNYNPSPSYTARCLPLNKPSQCSDNSWQKIKTVFNGAKCPELRTTIVGIGAPQYLSVPGYEDCLRSYNPSPSYTARCLPSNKPLACFDDSWSKIKRVFDGTRCPETNRIGIGAPEYLSVPGFEVCLGKYNPTSSSSSAWCIPSTKPSSCIQSAWDKIQGVFRGERCPMTIGLGAPEYLSVSGHEDCLGKYNPSPSYTAKCLPSNKPSSCSDNSWKKLKQVFHEKCPDTMAIGIGAPEYLSVIGYQDCLENYNPSPSYTAKCLPYAKPLLCSDDSWQEIQNVFEGDSCPQQLLGAIGAGIGAPEYLSVPGYEDCLENYNPSPSYTAKCIPLTRPSLCIPPAWEKLQNVFSGPECPKTGIPVTLPAVIRANSNRSGIVTLPAVINR